MTNKGMAKEEMDEWMDRQTDRWTTDGWTDGQTDRQTDGLTDGWADGQMDGPTDEQWAYRDERRHVFDGHNACLVGMRVPLSFTLGPLE